MTALHYLLLSMAGAPALCMFVYSGVMDLIFFFFLHIISFTGVATTLFTVFNTQGIFTFVDEHAQL